MSQDAKENPNLMNSAMEAMARGDRQAAQKLAEQAAAQSPNSEAPWLLLAALASPAERFEFIRKALKINPESPRAKQALQWALEQLPEQAQPAPVAEAAPGALEPSEIPPTAAPTAAPVAEQTAPAGAPGGKKWAGWQVAALLGFIALAGVAVLVAGWIFFGQQALNLLFPPKGCSPSLAFGGQTFAVQALQAAPGAAPEIPADQPQRAFWLASTQTNLVFLLSPLRDNLVLVSTLQAGSPAVYTQADCSTTTYTLTAAAPAALDSPLLQDQSKSQISIFVPAPGSAAGFLAQGELQGGEVTTFSTPDPNSLQLEISLLGVETSPDGQSITVDLSLSNAGQSAAQVKAQDIVLTPEGGAALALSLSAPALPLQVEPGKTVRLALTFPRPAAAAASLKILSAEFILDRY